MASRNDVTNDLICTKPSRLYEDNYSRIFRRANICVYCDEPVHEGELVKVKGQVYHRDCAEYLGE